MTLPTQPFTPEGGLLGCVLLYFGFHLLAVAQNFGLVLLQVAVGVAASPPKHRGMTLLATALSKEGN